MTQKEWTQKLQLALGLTPDGVFGPVTSQKSDLFDIELTLKAKPKPVFSGPNAQADEADYFGAPWIGSYIEFLGRHETDPALNAALVPEWAKEGLPGFKTLAGNDHAWCAVLVGASFRKVE